MAAPAPSGGGGGDAPAEDEGPGTFDVVLTGPGAKKIQVIKAVREAPGLGPKAAKAPGRAPGWGVRGAERRVGGAPKPIKEGLEKEEAEKLKGEIEEAGGSVE